MSPGCVLAGSNPSSSLVISEQPEIASSPTSPSSTVQGMSRVKNPQEKKRLSLDRDRRSNYGNNDKAARKAVPRRKAQVNRANRRADAVALVDAIGAPDEVVEAKVEDTVLGRRRKVWRKWPDLRLRTKVAEKLGDEAYVDPEVGRSPYR